MASNGTINLSSRPFVNARPVVRTTVLLWLVGALLLAWAGWRYFGYYAGRADQRDEIARIERQMVDERRTIAALQTQLAGLAPQDQNERVAFLNRRIAERTFSWSLLFDRLAGILPDDVRLITLAPQFSPDEPRSTRSRTVRPAGEEASGETRVRLGIQGAAKSSGDLLALIDALFADPAFDRPNPHQETRQGGESLFSLSVDYLPAAESPPTVDVEPRAGDAAVEATAGTTVETAAEASVEAAEPAPAGGEA